ncbi:hypothetical protein BKA61DRAFT_567498 [Leptodontidium sp. MPI-SDFR-AT-0119]|nr:hypothetical protein BKA61DRAFT_567498 [Leptodontidium sp. MPI-SDFR-AT-0119]
MKFTAAMILAFALVAAASPIDSKPVAGVAADTGIVPDVSSPEETQIIKKDEDSESDSIGTANEEKRRIIIKQVIKKHEDSKTEAAPTEDAATEDKRRIRIKQIIKKNGDSA